MALIFDSRIRATDASGNGYSGAKLTVYNANTVVLASVFTTSSLGTPLGNPVTADSNGVFPQIFAAEGATFDLVLKTAGGVTLYTQDDVVSQGANSAIITRDFTNARLRIAGAGGIVSIEAGDPSGDDVGGQMRIGGYAGSQADSISLDAAAITTTGKITENGKKYPGAVYTPATTVASASEGIIALPNDPAGCIAWDVDVWDLSMTASATLLMQLAYNGGAFKAGASDYTWQYTSAADTTPAPGSDVSDPQIICKPSGQIGATNFPGQMWFRVITPRTGNNGTLVRGGIRGLLSGAASVQMSDFHGTGGATYGAADRVRLYCSSGNIAFKYRVTPLRGWGEV
jgi:hypothetical protein